MRQAPFLPVCGPRRSSGPWRVSLRSGKSIGTQYGVLSSSWSFVLFVRSGERAAENNSPRRSETTIPAYTITPKRRKVNIEDSRIMLLSGKWETAPESENPVRIGTEIAFAGARVCTPRASSSSSSATLEAKLRPAPARAAAEKQS